MTAEEHRDTAARLLRDIADHPESPGEARVLTQAAIAHALLGLLELQLGSGGGPHRVPPRMWHGWAPTPPVNLSTTKPLFPE